MAPLRASDRLARMRPLWWRAPLWVVLIAYSVAAGHDTTDRVIGGVLFAVSVIALHLFLPSQTMLSRVTLVVCTAAGLAACYFLPGGVAEAAVLLAAARFATVIGGSALRVLTALDTVAFAVTIAVISRSPAGLLAGIGIPLVVQRSVEQRELIRERDRAQALLADAQRGRESEAEAAALSERSRIAREMHDVLAHSLAGLSVQLQAVRTLAAHNDTPEPLLGELDKAAELARAGLLEARAAVGTLRDPVGLALADIPALIDRHPGAADLVTSGTGVVTAAVGHAVYRAVQESLTNSARYAPGSPAAVTMSWAADTLTVTVSDSGPAPGRIAVAEQGNGLGLAGMSERVAAVGGTSVAGPRPGGGWMTTVRVPVS